ncbi:tetratricopeptide repeat protein [Actinomadura sp. 9N407]|uniref:tetratricopeptide repeat protein n=1 Tax=Actinomadura sp. 9N407 TaxID=3375154 RepID=UPI00378DB2E1
MSGVFASSAFTPVTSPCPPAQRGERMRAHGLLERASAAWRQGDLASAEEGFRAALAPLALLEDVHGVARVLSQIASLRAAVGDHAAAIGLYRQAVERAPTNTTALTGLGYALWRAGHPADGEVTFGQALRQDRRAVRALAGRGQVRAEMGLHTAALTDLDRALDLARTGEGDGDLLPGERADIRSARALSLALLTRFDEADTELQNALALSPDRARTLARAGRIAAMAGRSERARESLRRALRQTGTGGETAPDTEPLSASETRAVRRMLSLLETTP